MLDPIPQSRRIQCLLKIPLAVFIRSAARNVKPYIRKFLSHFTEGIQQHVDPFVLRHLACKQNHTPGRRKDFQPFPRYSVRQIDYDWNYAIRFARNVGIRRRGDLQAPLRKMHNVRHPPTRHP